MAKRLDICSLILRLVWNGRKRRKFIRDEHEKDGFNGRFGAGLPRISDGSLLFLQHLISKMRQDEKGSRIAIIFNGSPLFTGDAGSGESEIRRWIIENDMLEGIIALPDQLFYNTGISTYIWIVTNRKNNDPMNRACKDRKNTVGECSRLLCENEKESW
jgi:type I restriction enzyme M protein